MRRSTLVCVALCATLLTSCGGKDQGTGSPAAGGMLRPSPGGGAPRSGNLISNGRAITFPPRNEPFDFRNQLEAKYRDGLRRSAGESYVDIEGDIVWTQEYLRYRVNACDHAQAVQRVFGQIDTGAIAPECGTAPAGQVLFPPRNEPFDFRVQLEAKYRDGLRRGPGTTYVDMEGDIVWTQEYIRYRLNGCNHEQGVTRVFQQIDTGAIQPVCDRPPPTPTPTPTPDAPVARPGGPYGPVNTGTAISFNGLASTASGGRRITHYRWTCGQSGNDNCTADNPTPSFTYFKPPGTNGTTSTYTVTLVVEDSAGATSRPATTTVRVANTY